MYNNVAFIGGIHGVGKSTVCRHICDDLKIGHLSASDLLRWMEINEDPKNKKVTDVPATQDRLITGLTFTVRQDKSYVLDGHYCLLNLDNDVVRVPLDTFKFITPVSLNIILGDIDKVKRVLEKRDKKPYNSDLLKKMQDNELAYAKELSKILGATLNTGTQSDFTEILNSLHRSFCRK